MNVNYVTITQINQYIKYIFDNNDHLKKVYLRGEISNFKKHSSGHYYLTLKDDNSRINAIMFKSNTNNLLFTPVDGMNVLVEGRISAYPIGGTYQVYIQKMQEDGVGNLYIRYEELKRKLQAMGYFDSRYKKSIPKYPSKIGIVTAPTGAAIKDILSTIKRRFPICETILFPAIVQGQFAKESIASQIREAQNYDLDVLIIGRGGGSIEDLWAFNEEIVAKAIFESKIPIISAVGHEVDYTISDYVADMRAPTPTGAGEMAVPTMTEVRNILKTLTIKLNNALIKHIKELEHRLQVQKESYVLKNPIILYDVKMQKLDNLTDSIIKNITQVIQNKTMVLNQCSKHYIIENPQQLLEKKEAELQYLIQTLKLVNPLNILDKGYSLVKKDGVLIKDSKNLKKNDELEITLSKGKLNVLVKEKI